MPKTETPLQPAKWSDEKGRMLSDEEHAAALDTWRKQCAAVDLETFRKDRERAYVEQGGHSEDFRRLFEAPGGLRDQYLTGELDKENTERRRGALSSRSFFR